MAITIAQLKTFLAVAQNGSIKGAASKLMVTQPSVSSGIAALEKELKIKLVERKGRGITLTAAGHAFVPYASGSLGVLEEGQMAAREAADPEHRELRIAAVTTAGEYVIAPIIQAFRNRNPQVEIRLEVSNRTSVMHKVELREADVGIGGRPPESGKFEGMPFLDNPLVIIAAPDDPLVERPVTFKELESAMWLLREKGSGTRSFTENLLVDKGIRPSRMTIGSNGAIKQAVRAGLGISLQSRQAVALELGLGVLSQLDLKDSLPGRKWFALYPKESPKRQTVKTFLKFLKSDVAMEAIADSLAMPFKGLKS